VTNILDARSDNTNETDDQLVLARLQPVQVVTPRLHHLAPFG
jgi:hypothetical protein